MQGKIFAYLFYYQGVMLACIKRAAYALQYLVLLLTALTCIVLQFLRVKLSDADVRCRFHIPVHPRVVQVGHLWYRGRRSSLLPAVTAFRWISGSFAANKNCSG